MSMTFTYKFEGAKELEKALMLKVKGTKPAIRKAVRDSSWDLERAMRRKAVFTKGYSTGATKKSIGRTVEAERAEVGPKTPYAPYLEHGTRFMDAQPFVKPALDEVAPDFKRKLIAILESELK